MVKLTLLLFLAGCSAVELSEDGKAACSNGSDDDGDGLVDCADPSCAGSGACENTLEACRDGVDNDGDGTTDCQSPLCQQLGACDEFSSDCSFYPQAGCPAGMGCYRISSPTTGKVELVCRLAGQGVDAAACNGDALLSLKPSDPHECAPGYGCFLNGSANGNCGQYCSVDNDCPTGGTCQGAQVCTSACNPLVTGSICPQPGYACASFHQFNVSYEKGGARWFCSDKTIIRGDAGVGMPCDDPPTAASPTSRVCQSKLACVPGAGGATCHVVCDTSSPVCPSGSCVRLYPSGRPSGTAKVTLGVCQ